jgi:hypothetical protein
MFPENVNSGAFGAQNRQPPLRNTLLPVRSSALLLASAMAAACPALASGAEVRCWYEAGVLVAPAEVMGVAGDYVIDTGAPATLLADTPAQAAGFADTALTGEIRLAGLDLPERPVAVATLDARFRYLPTPVAGVIGADVLKDYVVDVHFAPCRIALWRPGAAPRFGPSKRLPLTWAGGRPAAPAAVSDGRRAWRGDFVLATGSDTPVRLRDDLADVSGAAKRDQLYAYGPVRPTLRALSFAGDLFENAPSGLLPKADLDADGEIGAPVLARYRLRFDFPRSVVRLAKEKGPPDRSDGP